MIKISGKDGDAAGKSVAKEAQTVYNRLQYRDFLHISQI